VHKFDGDPCPMRSRRAAAPVHRSSRSERERRPHHFPLLGDDLSSIGIPPPEMESGTPPQLGWQLSDSSA
jgi:hypothetical protein